MRAIVCFSDALRPRWLRLLRRGFQHCAVCVELSTRRWVAIHPLANGTLVDEVTAEDDPLASPAEGWIMPAAVLLTVVHAPIDRELAWRPYTCVEEVKRVLGRRWPWVLTPWQLYRALRQEGAVDVG